MPSSLSDQRSARPAGDRAAAGGVWPRSGRHPPRRPLRAGGLIHPRHGAPGAVQGPLRLHHNKGATTLLHGANYVQGDHSCR